jgi:hypothetical protein
MSISDARPRGKATSISEARSISGARSIRSTRWRLVLAASAAGLAVVFVAAGCGASDNGTTAGSKVATPADKAGAGTALDAGGGANASTPKQQNGAAPAQVPDKLPPDSRSIVYTGTITVRVRGAVDIAATQAAAWATGAGGFVGSEDRGSDASRSQAKLTLRVPSAKFSEVLKALHGLGDEESRSLSTEDVTEQVADVDARLANAQASVDRVRGLMARAQTIGEITSLESELSRREGDLESLKARQSKLSDLATLSTITAVLLGPDAAVVATPKKSSGFVAGLKSGWSALAASMVVVLTILGALLPWLVLLGVPLAIGWWLVRRSRRGHPVGAMIGQGDAASAGGTAGASDAAGLEGSS